MPIHLSNNTSSTARRISSPRLNYSKLKDTLSAKAASTSSAAENKTKQANSIGTASVTCNALNVRDGAGTNYQRIGGLTKGKSVAVYEEKNGWLKINYGSEYGWIDKTYTNYKKMNGTNYMAVDANKISLKDLYNWACAEGYDVTDLAQAAKFVATHCVDTSAHSNCTRGTSLFMQLASYARYVTLGGEAVNETYRSSSRADKFGNGSSNGNIRSDVSAEYTETIAGTIENQSTANKEIQAHLKTNGDYVTFNYRRPDGSESWHIVFYVDGKFYSDFKQGSPTGVKSGSYHFNNVRYYTH